MLRSPPPWPPSILNTLRAFLFHHPPTRMQTLHTIHRKPCANFKIFAPIGLPLTHFWDLRQNLWVRAETVTSSKVPRWPLWKLSQLFWLFSDLFVFLFIAKTWLPCSLSTLKQYPIRVHKELGAVMEGGSGNRNLLLSLVVVDYCDHPHQSQISLVLLSVQDLIWDQRCS